MRIDSGLSISSTITVPAHGHGNRRHVGGDQHGFAPSHPEQSVRQQHAPSSSLASALWTVEGAKRDGSTGQAEDIARASSAEKVEAFYLELRCRWTKFTEADGRRTAFDDILSRSQERRGISSAFFACQAPPCGINCQTATGRRPLPDSRRLWCIQSRPAS